MDTVTLVIGVIKKGDSILLRKKPDGSPPYKETWYLFGGEVKSSGGSPEDILKRVVKEQTGVEIEIASRIGWDTEVKPNHDGALSSYIYLDCLCSYVSGELTPAPGIEKLEWVPLSEISNYDLVPPSRKLLTKINYI